MIYRAGQVAACLAISPATLRLWSTNFAEYLSDGAALRTGGDKCSRQRRYIEDDVQVLRAAGQLLRQGLTYEQTKTRLVEGSEGVDSGAGRMASTPLIPTNYLLNEQAACLVEKERTIVLLEDLLARQQKATEEAKEVAERLLEAKDSERAAQDRELSAHRRLSSMQRRQVLALGQRVQELERELARGNPRVRYASGDQNPWWRRLLDGP